MPTTPIVSKLRRPTAPLFLLAALFVAAGGIVHLREWLDTYRHVPASVPGADVVRVGFVINAAASAVLAFVLLAAVLVGRRAAVITLALAALFETASLATLIQTRRGTVLGWMESGWSRGATQTRAVEVGALILLAAAAVFTGLGRRDHRRRVETLDPLDAVHRREEFRTGPSTAAVHGEQQVLWEPPPSPSKSSEPTTRPVVGTSSIAPSSSKSTTSIGLRSAR